MLVVTAVAAVALFAFVSIASASPADVTFHHGGQPATTVQVQAAPTPVVHTVVQDKGSQTVAISLAGAALLVALGAGGFALLRMAPRRRSATDVS